MEEGKGGEREREGHTGGHLVSWSEWDVDTIAGAVVFKSAFVPKMEFMLS